MELELACLGTVEREIQWRKMDFWKNKLYVISQRLQFRDTVIVYLKPSIRVPIGLRRVSKEPRKKWVIRYLTNQGGSPWYGGKSGGRSHHIIPIPKDILLATERVEHVHYHNDFKSFQEFWAKFDLRFISEKKIEELWREAPDRNGRCKYKKSDFKRMGKRGKEVMEKFLEKFSSVHFPTEHYEFSDYSNKSYPTLLLVRYSTWSNKGRDIQIVHNLSSNYVYYTSELHERGSGNYYFVANKREVLFIEND